MAVAMSSERQNSTVIQCETTVSVISELLKEKDSKDIALTGYDRKIEVSAHKEVLVASSSFFEGMFSVNGGWKENEESLICLEEFASEVIKDMIDFLYTGRIDVEHCGIPAIYEYLRAADYFDIPNLSRLFLLYLATMGEIAARDESFLSLSPENMDVLLRLHQLDCSEVILFQALEKWFDAHLEISADTVEKLSGLIRYCLIPMKDLHDKVKQSRWKNELLFTEALRNWDVPSLTFKVPQCVSRANRWTLLPLCQDTEIICGCNVYGEVEYKVLHPSFAKKADDCLIAGFLFSLTTLECPVRFSIHSNSSAGKKNKPSNPRSPKPKSFEVIVLQWCLGKPYAGQVFPYSGPSRRQRNYPRLQPQLFLPHPQFVSLRQPVHQNEGKLLKNTSHQIDATKLSTIEISKSDKNVLIRSGNHISTLASSCPDTECYLQMALQFGTNCDNAVITLF
jgi:hypothetical protein